MQNNERKKNINYVWVVPLMNYSDFNRPVAKWRHFTTMTRILFIFPFMFNFGNQKQKRFFAQEGITRRILIVVWRYRAIGLYIQNGLFGFMNYDTSTGKYDRACALSMKCSTDMTICLPILCLPGVDSSFSRSAQSHELQIDKQRPTPLSWDFWSTGSHTAHQLRALDHTEANKIVFIYHILWPKSRD